jgi:hypothetical protein
MRENRVGSACHLYRDCWVGVARCGQEVRIDIRIDAQRRPVDVQMMGICCVS